MSSQRRSDEARQVLVANSRGSYTVPTPGLYPFQWNWDSAFTALGWAEFDPERAWLEVETLLQAQWSSGMLPHIVFWTDESTYFPGPDVWRTADQTAHTAAAVATSGLSQPPVLASVVRQLGERDPSRVVPLLDALDASHRWWHTARDPGQRGVIAVSHPWESGRDNLPDWDDPLAGVPVGTLPSYQRRDLDLVDASMRPHQADYDRYLALVELGAAAGWDDATIAASSPFWVADPGVTAILLRAERDLSVMMSAAGRSGAEVDRRVERLERGFDQFWNASAGTYCSFDLRTGRHAEHGTAASFLAPYAGVTDHQDQVLGELESWSEQCSFVVPSFDPRAAAFEADRYWRGPVWLVLNYMIARGLDDVGCHAEAEAITRSSRELVDRVGFAESFNPLTGTAVGGGQFSWTAALWLAWLAP